MKALITRREGAATLDLSERQFDRIRKQANFTEVHVTDSRKGLRFLSKEVMEYLDSRTIKPQAG